jgi:hypothetical protein
MNTNSHPNRTDLVGDLFSILDSMGGLDRTIIIPHVCNDEYVMRSGFVVPLIQRWPVVKERYVASRLPLGHTEFINVEDSNNLVVVANMIAQHKTIRSHPKPIRYLHLANCMERVRDAIHNEYKATGWFEPATILCPRFGSGLAGGNWDFISELINEIWCDNGIHVTTVELPTT